MERLTAYIDEKIPLINKALDEMLPRADIPPSTLHEAMRYSVIGGGKRLRAMLVLMGAHICGGTEDEALPAACAIEMVHGYSLAHDDLPSMDDDDLRRGKLTTHKAYDEATAILAGDALLTFAFEVLAGAYSPRKALSSIKTLSRAAGHVGMVGGQMLDLEAVGKEIEIEDLEGIHRRKTGALIAASCRIGGVVGGGEKEDLEKLYDYGRALGLAFQITDDILDATGSSEELGKTSGKDARDNKPTYVTIYGVEQAREMAREAANEAKNLLNNFGSEALMARLLADYVLERKK